eukprot:9882925-Lingulodinium_polyedra.AAC.1
MNVAGGAGYGEDRNRLRLWGTWASPNAPTQHWHGRHRQHGPLEPRVRPHRARGWRTHVRGRPVWAH